MEEQTPLGIEGTIQSESENIETITDQEQLKTPLWKKIVSDRKTLLYAAIGTAIVLTSLSTCSKVNNYINNAALEQQQIEASQESEEGLKLRERVEQRMKAYQE